MSASSSTRDTQAPAAYWFQFFLDSGIPPSDAGNYAVAFTENRIQRDMLNDLSKDYLNDMGITVMGDTIAILKHAKLVHSQDARDKVLKTSAAFVSVHERSAAVVKSAQVANVAKPSQFVTVAKPPTVKMMPISLGDRLAEKSVAAKPTQAVSKPMQQQSVLSNAPQKVTSDARVHAEDREKTCESKVGPGVKDKQRAEVKEGLISSSSKAANLVRLKPQVMEEVPVKKVHNVTPQQEGPYKVSMLSKTTEKSRKVLQQQNAKSAHQSAGVFSRLGKETALDPDSGSESFSSSSSSGPEIITDNRKEKQITTTKAPQPPASIFSRLGEKVAVKRAASSTWDDEDVGVGVKTMRVTENARVPSAKVPSDNVARISSAAKVVTLTVTKPVGRDMQKAYQQNSAGIFGLDVADVAKSEAKPARYRLGKKVPEAKSRLGKKSTSVSVGQKAVDRNSAASRLGTRVTASPVTAGFGPKAMASPATTRLGVKVIDPNSAKARLGAKTVSRESSFLGGGMKSDKMQGAHVSREALFLGGRMKSDDMQKPIVSSTTQDQPIRTKRMRQDEPIRIKKVQIKKITFDSGESGGRGSTSNTSSSVFSRLGKV